VRPGATDHAYTLHCTKRTQPRMKHKSTAKYVTLRALRSFATRGRTDFSSLVVLNKNTSFLYLESLLAPIFRYSDTLHVVILASGASGGLLGEKNGVDVGEDTTLGDGDTREELGELLIVADSKLNVTGDNTGLLVVAGSVTGELEDLSAEVLEDSAQVDGGTTTEAVGVLALLQVTSHTSNGELKPSLGGLAHNRALATASRGRLASFSSSLLSHSVCIDMMRRRVEVGI